MLRGVARASWGSKRRGSHSQSWQSRKNVRTADSWLAFADAGFEPGGPFHEVADAHPVQRGDPGGAGLPGPCRRIGGLRVLGGQPSAGLEQVGADAAADAWRQRGGGVPAVRPLGPDPGFVSH